MAEFTKVAHEWVRMCKAYSDAGDCLKCPMVTNPICGYMSDDNVANDKEISKAEADIMSWAAEHPEPVYPTWAEYLETLELYNKSVSDSVMIDKLEITHIPAGIAQKLGIEPKEVNRGT